jgi:hypothetical protein
MIEKYMIKNLWGIDQISQEFLDKFYCNENIFLMIVVERSNIVYMDCYHHY